MDNHKKEEMTKDNVQATPVHTTESKKSEETKKPTM